MYKVLITGAFGFLGRNIALKYKKNGYEVFGIGHGKWIGESYSDFGISKWIEGDINLVNLSYISDNYDVIVHCGGSGSVSYSVSNPMQDFQKTVDSTLAVLEFMRIYCPFAILVYPSSPAVHGQMPDIRIKESDKRDPLSPYGFHKVISEVLCESYYKNYGLKIIIIRFFSIYGVGLRKQLLWDACSKIQNAKNEAFFFGTGKETRDLIHVNDASDLVFYLSNRYNGKLEIYNGGSGEKHTIKEIIDLLVKSFDKEIAIKFTNVTKVGDPQFYHADIVKLREIGWEPRSFILDGISEYVSFFKNSH